MCKERAKLLDSVARLAEEVNCKKLIKYLFLNRGVKQINEIRKLFGLPAIYIKI